MKPRYIIDLDKLAETARIAKGNAGCLGVHLLMALKSFPLPSAFPALLPSVEGFTCSGLYEAKLARAGLPASRHQVHVHAPAYTEDEMEEICATCSHVVFNSLAQLARFGAYARGKGCSVGLRVNPGFSSADCLAYDPCCPDSRFGVTWEELEALERLDLLEGLEGIHIHALCEGYADDFAELVERFAAKLGQSDSRTLQTIKRSLRWINLGGGEVINDPAFATPRAIAAVRKLKELLHSSFNTHPSTLDVYIEPSEYLVRYAGYLEAHVLDVIRREKDIAVLDVSGSCHATDLLLFKMKPDVIEPAQAEGGRTTILGCVSCLAGDVLGEYDFAKPLAVGDTVVFGGLGCYSFAQQSWFNGIRHPDLVLRSKADGERTVLSWDYADYQREFHRA